MPVQDISEEKLEEMGFKKFRITKEGYIHLDDVEAFLEYDRQPSTEEEKAYMKKCVELFLKMPIHSSVTSQQPT